MLAFPAAPVNSVCVGLMLTVVVHPIEVRSMTGAVPPSTLVSLSTITFWRLVIVTVFGGKWQTTMSGQGITGGTYQTT